MPAVVERAGQLKAGEMICHPQPVERFREARTHQLHSRRDAPLRDPGASAAAVVEGPPHPGNPKFFGNFRHCLQYRGKQVRMFVSIDVAGLDSRGQDAADLRSRLVVNGNFAPQQRTRQGLQGRGLFPARR